MGNITSIPDVTHTIIKNNIKHRIPNFTHRKLQTIVYFIDALYLKLNDRRLIGAPFTMTEDGPVNKEIADLYLDVTFEEDASDLTIVGTLINDTEFTACMDLVMSIFTQFNQEEISLATNSKGIKQPIEVSDTMMKEQFLFNLDKRIK